MIDRQKGIIYFICDECNDFIDTETRDFRAALDSMKEQGWTIKAKGRSNNGKMIGRDVEYVHRCPGCSK